MRRTLDILTGAFLAVFVVGLFVWDGWPFADRLPSVRAKVGPKIELVPNPTIVILGSSRPAFGIVPSVMEQELGLPKGSVLNAAFPGMYPDDIELAWFVYREHFRKVKLVIYSTDDYYLSEPPGYKNKSLENTILQLGPLRRASNIPSNLSWLFEGAQNTQYWIDEHGLLRHPMVDENERMKDQASRDAVAAGVTDAWWAGWKSSAMSLRIIAFTNQLKLEGKEVVFLHMPMSTEQRKATRERYAEGFKMYRSGMAYVAEETSSRLYFLDKPEDGGLTDKSFKADTMHLRPAEAEIFTRHFTRMLKVMK